MAAYSPDLFPNRSNQLLMSLRVDEMQLLAPHLEAVTLDRLAKLEYPSRPIEHVYFIESGIGSVVAPQASATVEIGIMGREGMSGIAIVHGDNRSPYSTFMQVGGSGQRIAAPKLAELMEQSKQLRSRLLQYAQTFLIQSSQTAVANARATIEERLARWLLMCHDRVDGDELPLTHEFLSLMMGAGRPGVTEAIHVLVRQGVIRGQRGVITVLDRDGLLARAGTFYGTPEREYERLFPFANARTVRAV